MQEGQCSELVYDMCCASQNALSCHIPSYTELTNSRRDVTHVALSKTKRAVSVRSLCSATTCSASQTAPPLKNASLWMLASRAASGTRRHSGGFVLVHVLSELYTAVPDCLPAERSPAQTRRTTSSCSTSTRTRSRSRCSPPSARFWVSSDGT